ncbi:MAG TPA: hypothetical protein VFL78_07135 [Rhodanobacteraceae bacterium]|nr:hypothetical protein [Rhodanobacteraceae bacterium]
MKLSKAQENYSYASGTASSICRQLAFAGIAIVWVFNLPTSESPVHVPQQLQVVILLLVVCLVLDLLQYVVASLIWSYFARRIELEFPNDHADDPDMAAPAILNWPALVCFWSKIVVLLVAYIFLAVFVGGKLLG